MSKPRARNKCVRIEVDVLEMWDILKTHKIRSAMIFKRAGEKAIREKYDDFVKNYNNPYTNIIRY